MLLWVQGWARKAWSVVEEVRVGWSEWMVRGGWSEWMVRGGRGKMSSVKK